jgi:type II secretory pathway pseudopilin PulG
MKKGFTLIEISASVAILIIIAAIITAALANFRGDRELDRADEAITGLIRQARERTLASEKGNQFGVRFENARAILFQGPVFNPGDPNNKIYNISSSVEIFNINISGANVVFERLTGNAFPNGDISIKLKASPNKLKTIFIGGGGSVYSQ